MTNENTKFLHGIHMKNNNGKPLANNMTIGFDNENIANTQTSFIVFDYGKELIHVVRANNDAASQSAAPIQVDSAEFEVLQFMRGRYDHASFPTAAEELFGGILSEDNLKILIDYFNEIHNEGWQNPDAVPYFTDRPVILNRPAGQAKRADGKEFVTPPANKYKIVNADGSVIFDPDMKTVEIEDDMSINDAIKNAGTATTKLVLNAVIAEDVVVEPGQNITIDLNGFGINPTTDQHAIINHGNLTLLGTGSISSITDKKAALYNDVDGTVVINGPTLERAGEAGTDSGSGGNSWYTIYNLGKMTINYAEVKNSGAYSSCLVNGWQDGSQNTSGKEAVLTINDGIFTGGINTIKNDDCGNLTINGGTFDNFNQAVIMNAHKMTINGGLIVSSNVNTIALLDYFVSTSPFNNGTLIINDAYIFADKVIVKHSSGFAINALFNGGHFKVDPATGNYADYFNPELSVIETEVSYEGFVFNYHIG